MAEEEHHHNFDEECHMTDFTDEKDRRRWTEPARVSKDFMKQINRELAAKALSSLRLCQVLTIKMTGCGLSINWCEPQTLKRGNMDEGASFRLYEYGRLEPLQLFVVLYKKDGFWYSKVEDHV